MSRTVPALFVTSVFVAAFLLFSVQPMIARIVLPALGGTPTVWTTCMLFFQAALLAGYAYALVVGKRLGPRGQALIHLALLGSALACLPIAVPQGPASELALRVNPTPGLLMLLARSVGLPVFVLGTSAPLLQHWYARARSEVDVDPYPLYAASNAGSLAALMAYPAWVERYYRLGEQVRLWGVGFGALAALVAACALLLAVRGRGESRSESAVPGPPIGLTTWLGWVVLAMIPSSLMLGVTSYLTTDLAAIPLLWVVPLALYLLSYIIVFADASSRPREMAARVVPWLVMALTVALGVGLVQPAWVPVHLAAFFAAAVVCHGELAGRRPPSERLTSFYLAIATGGALGGLFNAVVAPVVFDRIAEYPLAIVAACLVLAFRGDRKGPIDMRRDLAIPVAVGLITAALVTDLGGLTETAVGPLATTVAAGLTVLVAVRHRRRPLRFALTVGALLAASGLTDGVNGRVIDRERSFFGVLKVTDVPEGPFHRLFHGSTLHGQQSLAPDRRREPLTYFTRSGPVGDVFEALRARLGPNPARVAVTGVGVGSLAAYSRVGDDWTFFEIDPAVVRVAFENRYFTFLADSPATALRVRLGDARLTMAREPDRSFDLIVLDAFSSDAIPVHLVTREALQVYLRKLRTGGWLAFNISNRYIDLAPVVAALAADAGLTCRVRSDPSPTPSEKAAGKQGSIWAVMASSVEDLGRLAHDPRWQAPQPIPGDPVWSDDYSNLVSHLRIFRGRPVNAPRRERSARRPGASRGPSGGR
jgi:hypothetical protein